ncbi:MAG TPA: transglycosylase SLT domain-containing protein, partial [Candidatus Eisenbacteria bacterium]|nr:transglycosylase SLT domain-containing protein [Candidatus Eisenbacteria bacterium]
EALITATPGDPLAVEAWRMRSTLAETVPLNAGDRVQLLGLLLNNPTSDAEAELREMEHAPDLSAGRRVDASLALARFQYRRKRYDQALAHTRALTGTAGAGAEARLIEARIHRNAGRLQLMETTYRSLMNPRSGQGVTAAWELAKEWESRSEWQKAAKVYSELLSKFPASPRERDATFRRGFTRVMQGKKKEALSDFRNAYRLSRTPNEKEQAAFWSSRTLWTLGRRRDAVIVARRAAQADEPADAYGVLLRERFGVPAPTRPSPEDIADQGAAFEAMCWSCDAVRAVLPPELRATYRTGLSRLDLGLKSAVRRDWRRAVATHKPGARDLQLFALTASAYDLYPEATQWAKQAMTGPWLSDPERIALRRVTYPAAHGGLVLIEASRNGLDPAWVWALMRQESFYDPEAVSHKGAMGLMQIMPATLTRLTTENDMGSLPPEVLFRPNTNIAFGTRFFADRLSEFGGHLFPTLAGYNAGEAKSREWIERSKGDTQEIFLECIGYPETYDYVRRIVWNTWLYHHLYSEGNGIG